jgi:hypothetical protein
VYAHPLVYKRESALVRTRVLGGSEKGEQGLEVFS